MSLIKFSIQANSENPTKTAVKARNFNLVVDEPKNLGGTDEGATPVEFLLAALAGCLNVVGHLVAKEMGFTLEGIDIYIEGQLDPAKFSGQTTDARPGFQNIKAVVTPQADVDQSTLDTWLKTVEDRCPISDNIAHETPVSIVIGQ